MEQKLLFAKLLKGLSSRMFRLSKRIEYFGGESSIFRYIDCFETIDVLLKFIQPKCLCDIGANAGHWTYVLSQMSPTLEHVVFFEPQSQYQEKLQSLSLPRASKVIYHCGLGEREDKLLIKGGTSSASFLDSEQQNKYFPNSISQNQQDMEEVEIRTLDATYASDNLPIPDVIKLDVQGFELEVLKGSMNLLKKSKYLVIELSFRQFWLSWIWWVKCILRYIPPSEGVERTTKTQRTQRLIDPM
ncbi:FkbM family methyltransferase [Microcystis aeruginosa]|uniref:FkbM family methyltransferase n=1 Tax=Microcystis aeruginosa TaxID=1126 RepID=UPI001D15AC9E|nr:FkbM family methyltransferase [Microcystis aeruginosa]